MRVIRVSKPEWKESITLFPNNKKTKSTEPDYTGYGISAWINEVKDPEPKNDERHKPASVQNVI